MNNYLSLKLDNKEQAEIARKTLEKIGFRDGTTTGSKFRHGIKTIWVDETCNEYMFVYDNHVRASNQFEANTWKDFVFQFLKDFYCVMPSSDDKKRIQGLTRKHWPRSVPTASCLLYEGNMHYPVFSFFTSVFGFGDMGDVKTKKEISFTNLIILLESVSEFEELNNKENKTMNKKCHKVKNKFELVAAIAYLKEYFKENDVKFTMHDIEGFMLGGKVYFCNLVGGEKYTICGCSEVQESFVNVSLEEFAKYLLEECSSNNVFNFKNGLVAEYDKENNSVKIGCKERSLDFWGKFVSDVINLDEDFNFAGNNFKINEVQKFKGWLNKIAGISY